MRRVLRDPPSSDQHWLNGTGMPSSVTPGSGAFGLRGEGSRGHRKGSGRHAAFAKGPGDPAVAVVATARHIVDVRASGRTRRFRPA